MFSLIPSVRDAFDNMQDDYDAERDSTVFAIINKMAEMLAKNPDGETVVKDHVVGLLDKADA
jgi:hypothetical protein